MFLQSSHVVTCEYSDENSFLFFRIRLFTKTEQEVLRCRIKYCKFHCNLFDKMYAAHV
jgi:hypothetical protein